MIPKLLELVDSFARAPDATVDERQTGLFLHGPLDAAGYEAWPALVGSPSEDHPLIWVSSVRYEGTFADVEPESEFEPGERVVITLRKEPPGNVELYVREPPASFWPALPPGMRRLACAALRPEEGFATLSMEVSSWAGEELVAEPALPREDGADPRRLLHDLTRGSEVTGDLRPWLLLEDHGPARESATFQAWQRVAARRLMGALSRLVTEDANGVGFHFRSQGGRRITTKEAEDATLLSGLDAAARWVFRSGADADVRHQLFATELDRFIDREPLQDAIARALPSAKAAYEAHVSSATRETLRALTELRRGVMEETQRLTQRAFDLSSSLWAGLALTGAPFAFKAAAESAMKSEKELRGVAADHGTQVTVFFVLAALLLALHAAVALTISTRAMNAQMQSRAAWLASLKRYVSDVEYNALVTAPVNSAEASFRWTRLGVGLAYALLVGALIWGFCTRG